MLILFFGVKALLVTLIRNGGEKLLNRFVILSVTQRAKLLQKLKKCKCEDVLQKAVKLNRLSEEKGGNIVEFLL